MVGDPISGDDLPLIVRAFSSALLSDYRFFTYYAEPNTHQAEISTDEIFLRFEANQTARKHMSVMDPAEALQSLSTGIANRAVGGTQMNMASSRSHCIYIFTVQQELGGDKRMKTGKLVLVDLVGSKKVEKTGAEGRALEEAKMINKSLSALGNVINALTCGSSRANHIPYRDSKFTQILQDALGGNSRTALLCCCSPSVSNASESLSTLRFGARAKHIKASPRVNCNKDKYSKKHEVLCHQRFLIWMEDLKLKWSPHCEDVQLKPKRPIY